MHAPKSLPGACIACTPQLKVYRPPNRTLINHYSIQMPQSALEKRPRTQTVDPGACNGLGAHILRAKRCKRRVHTRLGARISWLLKKHAYNMVHAPMGVKLACYCPNHLQLGVPLPWEPMLGVLSFQIPILGVLFSQRSTLGVLSPQEPMNMSGQLGKNLQQGGKADQRDASHSGL